MKRLLRDFSVLCIALSAVMLVSGASAMRRALDARNKLAGLQARRAECLDPELAREQAWLEAVSGFPRITGKLPAVFFSPNCSSIHSSSRFISAANATKREERYRFERISAPDLALAASGSHAAGYRISAISIDAVSPGFVSSEIALTGILEKQ